MDLGKSASTSATLKNLQEDGALPGRGSMEREAGGTNPQPILGHMVAIEDYVLCGFLPPPSEFLLLVLKFYGLSLLHLNPNSIAFLSIFVHLCEAYIGCPFSRSKWRNRWFYLEIKDSNPVFVVPEDQPDKIPAWTAKPPLTPSLQSFIDIIDDLQERGLSGYEVVADFVGLSSEVVERRVGQVMISGPTTASDIPVPLCEKGATERDEAINALPLTDIIGPLANHQVATSLKEKVVKEASDAATTSGGNVPTKPRKFSSILGHRRKAATPSASDASPPPPRRQRIVMIGEKEARAKAARAKSGGASSTSPAAASTDVVPAAGSREATPSGPVSDPAGGRGLPAAVLTWEELQVEMGRLLEAGARGIDREIAEARSEAATVNARADRLVRKLAEAHEDLTKMRELVAGNERQRKGLEDRMSELGNNLSKIRGSLRFCMLISEAFVHCRDADDEDVQQRGQPESLAIIPVLELEPHISPDNVDQTLGAEAGIATTTSNLEDALESQDRRIQYWKTKFEVAELERTMLAVKKEQAVETLRGREVWFNSYLKSCCTSMARVCRELRVVRGDPEESAAGYISWLNGACAQLDGIGKRIDEALKHECRRAS
uniref:Retrotransposon protein, putative, unclassified n=1 Tax=Oryza sativa subsp. japonica TaxID=39947 RepID=Q2QPX0_ORYSJ|nr:retrotransposon protein, putative, unclassified [Oryza sativa Japonica Group]